MRDANQFHRVSRCKCLLLSAISLGLCCLQGCMCFPFTGHNCPWGCGTNSYPGDGLGPGVAEPPPGIHDGSESRRNQVPNGECGGLHSWLPSCQGVASFQRNCHCYPVEGAPAVDGPMVTCLETQLSIHHGTWGLPARPRPSMTRRPRN